MSDGLDELRAALKEKLGAEFREVAIQTAAKLIKDFCYALACLHHPEVAAKWLFSKEGPWCKIMFEGLQHDN